MYNTITRYFKITMSNIDIQATEQEFKDTFKNLESIADQDSRDIIQSLSNNISTIPFSKIRKFITIFNNKYRGAITLTSTKLKGGIIVLASIEKTREPQAGFVKPTVICTINIEH